jgi:hypothetical protein
MKELDITRAVSRRSFVSASALASILAMTHLDVVGAAVRSVLRSRPLSSLHLKTFRALRGERFAVWHGGRQTVVTLTTVQGSETAGTPAECFSLRFRLVRGRALAQGTYRFSNHSVGSFPLFVVPSGQQKPGSYTAIINRIG